MRLSAVALMLFLTACSAGTAVVQDLQSQDDTTPLPDAGEDQRGTPDAAPDVVESDETVFADVAPDETGTEPACEPGEGCFLDPCTENSQCQSGWCVDHMGEGVCSMLCQEECPPGWSCEQTSGGPDLTYVCVSAHANLCRPCATGNDCKDAAGVENVCVDYGTEGSFCGSPCADDDDCPWGFSCADAVTVDGISTSQCVAESGVCPCTEKSVNLALWTPCEVTNEFGTCTGMRVCSEEGLSDCDATIPAEESCNGLDDDCDGDVDEPTEVAGDYVNLCADENPCTDDLCNGEEGCEHIALTEGECLDGDPCTIADHCVDGVCVGETVNCDDENPCTDDSCDQAGGCVHEPNLVKCDDGDPCTVGDSCEAGVCAGVAVNCDCQEDADCAALEDGDLCNGTLVCNTDTLPYQCQVDPTTLIECPAADGIGAICLVPACAPESGACSLVPANEGLLCDDGDACTVGDTCQEGACAAGVDVNCNDGNLCTDDSCAPETGCLHTPNQADCDDANVCTLGDTCAAAECVPGFETLACDDANPCTDDSCEPTQGCLHLANQAECDDGNACTVGETCGNGECQTGSALLDCDDANPCTDDLCDPQQGCLHSHNTAPCSDDDPCTLNDHCASGECVAGASVDCDDGNPCTDDSCGPDGLCLHTANEAACDDGNACTIGDHCAGGACVHGGLTNCNDDNICTDDSCDPQAGCIHLVNTHPCDDGNICTLGDTCAAGACEPGEQTLVCNDFNICTDDSCDPEAGCLYTHNEAPCDDGNACTDGDSCSAGACAPGAPTDCADGNVCTDDSCNPASGCVHTPNTNPCEDGSLCTAFDLCADSICVPGNSVVCNDNNVCTDDGCDPNQGCLFTANEAPCSDGNACTVADQCAEGTCLSGAALDCDDGEECTTDGCDALTGCTHQALPDFTPCGPSPLWNCQGGVCTECVPNCAGKVCGDDGCGGTCGECGSYASCQAGGTLCVQDKILIYALNNAHNGALGGISGANALCNQQAAAAGINRTFRAFLATQAEPLTSFFTGAQAAVPVYNGNNEKLFNQWNDIFANQGNFSPYWMITFDGKVVDEGTGANPDWYDADAWHGSLENGAYYGENCNDWTSNASNVYSSATELDANQLLRVETSHPCNQTLAVMCVSVAP